jgi:hypothetical protein
LLLSFLPASSWTFVSKLLYLHLRPRLFPCASQTFPGASFDFFPSFDSRLHLSLPNFSSHLFPCRLISMWRSVQGPDPFSLSLPSPRDPSPRFVPILLSQLQPYSSSHLRMIVFSHVHPGLRSIFFPPCFFAHFLPFPLSSRSFS